MQTYVKKWGNSASIRIPAVIMETLHLELENKVDIREEGGKIIIEPVREFQYQLHDLVAEITDKNKHDAVEFGEAMGKEAF